MKKVICLISVCLCLCLQLVYAAPPDLPDISGSGWLELNDNTLGHGYLYVPIDTVGSWGLIYPQAYLFNVSSSTISGIFTTDSGTTYNVRAYSFSVPQYRQVGTSYTYNDMHSLVVSNNVGVEAGSPKYSSFDKYYPYILCGFLGVIIVCMMRYKR